MNQPVVAIVGRPNVGKSTLVNRIVGGRPAIVEELPGVTRDRKEFEVEWLGRTFLLVDTGGWLESEDALAKKVSAQAERAIAEADVVVMVADVTVGVTEEDARVAGILRKIGTPVVLAVNKVDDARRALQIWEFLSLGMGDPLPVSALHGDGTGDVLDKLLTMLTFEEIPEFDADAASKNSGAPAMFAVAVVGRPNVGKSSLFNKLVGEDRAVVHDMPGTTRDSIDTIVEAEWGAIRFVDTAGMRRKSRIDEGTEYYSLVRALQSLDEANGTLLVIDATEGVTAQDQRLAERVDASGNAVVVVLNKWDLLNTEQREECRESVARMLSFLGYAPVVATCASSGKNVNRLIPALLEARDAYRRRIPTGELNRVLGEAQLRHAAPPERGRRPRILYGTQGAIDPPTFTLFSNGTISASYLRYIERSLREAFDIGPTPIKLRVRRRGDH